MEFIPGKEEKTVPDVRLTRSKDGTNGVATFSFDDPDLFEESQEITGMFLQDEEGELSTTDVKARFVNGQPVGIQARFAELCSSTLHCICTTCDDGLRAQVQYADAGGVGQVHEVHGKVCGGERAGIQRGRRRRELRPEGLTKASALATACRMRGFALLATAPMLGRCFLDLPRFPLLPLL